MILKVQSAKLCIRISSRPTTIPPTRSLYPRTVLGVHVDHSAREQSPGLGTSPSLDDGGKRAALTPV